MNRDEHERRERLRQESKRSAENEGAAGHRPQVKRKTTSERCFQTP